jgi:type IV secretory pathway VirB10-like protein
VILIKLNKRLLVVAVVGAALILGVAMIVSLKGDDKPAINVNPPAADDEPVDDAPVTPADEPYVPPTSDDDDDAADDPEEPGDDDVGPGDDDDDSSDDEKARGLARAAQVHQRNMERMMDKGKTAPSGLQQSLEMLAEKYAAMQADGLDNLNNNGKHKGWGQSGKA